MGKRAATLGLGIEALKSASFDNEVDVLFQWKLCLSMLVRWRQTATTTPRLALVGGLGNGELRRTI